VEELFETMKEIFLLLCYKLQKKEDLLFGVKVIERSAIEGAIAD
jgi:hypothetical protein